ncbi:anti-sigma factor [Phytomonospora sp. NPDC050363]|uniref:anti-sigma factor n=1 Tax=Phytomonospora sp. NPDC050363 TaxID=3155642 RepID=UPI0033E56B7A
MIHDEPHTLLGAYVLNALDDHERARFEVHLGACSSCAAEAAELSGTAARLADGLSAEPPATMRASVMEAVRATPQLTAEDRPVPRRPAPAVPRPRRNLVTLAAAIVAVAALALSAFVYVTGQARVDDLREQVDARDAEAARVAAVLAADDAVLTTAPAADGGSISVVTSASRNAAVVTRVGMPGLSADQAYQLWRDVDGVMVSAGLMPHVSGLVAGIVEATAIGLSVEPAGGSPQPTHAVGVIAI